MGKTARCDYLNLFCYQGRANEQIRRPGSDIRLADYICYYCHYRAGFRIWPTWRWGRWDVSSILQSRLLSILLAAAAAIFQSVAYGAFTFAGGIFATLTSVAMAGRLSWPAAVSAAIRATTVAGTVWIAGVGRWFLALLNAIGFAKWSESWKRKKEKDIP